MYILLIKTVNNINSRRLSTSSLHRIKPDAGFSQCHSQMFVFSPNRQTSMAATPSPPKPKSGDTPNAKPTQPRPRPVNANKQEVTSSTVFPQFSTHRTGNKSHSILVHHLRIFSHSISPRHTHFSWFILPIIAPITQTYIHFQDAAR